MPDSRDPVRAAPEDPAAVADRTGVAAALLVSAASALAGVRATSNSGTIAVTCSYTGGSFTRAAPAGPGRGTRELLATVLLGAPVGAARVFVESRLHPTVVAVAGGWRAFALEADGWLLLAVVPDRPGEGTAPHLRLVGPGANRAGEARGAA
ncbi:hypothetical protein [Kitasatospora sp. MBT66]|uniref:hypothetical protein n=1 Tax=Kitasatospora sp. MBT66 TaxID=1444769 RepID=UPI000A4D40C6|nr:hypothetical protein [Kitasatospora sp. MBT66]